VYGVHTTWDKLAYRPSSQRLKDNNNSDKEKLIQPHQIFGFDLYSFVIAAKYQLISRNFNNSYKTSHTIIGACYNNK
jgi:hypothetical protein